jgi:PQQ enzyme repeat
LVTDRGLVFIGAAMDNYLRTFDIETGRELWKGRLPAGGQATPMTYRSTENGRQFVVIAAGGHGRLGTDIGDSVVAFALPDTGADVLKQATARTVFEPLESSSSFPRIRARPHVRTEELGVVPLLAILLVIATWLAWLVSQATPVTVLVLFAAVAIAWLSSLGRNRKWRRSQA